MSYFQATGAQEAPKTVETIGVNTPEANPATGINIDGEDITFVAFIAFCAFCVWCHTR